MKPQEAEPPRVERAIATVLERARFLAAWQASGGRFADPAEVARVLGLPLRVVRGRASNYRRQGFRLKSGRLGRRPPRLPEAGEKKPPGGTP